MADPGAAPKHAAAPVPTEQSYKIWIDVSLRGKAWLTHPQNIS
jgi:hypothetical protein